MISEAVHDQSTTNTIPDKAKTQPRFSPPESRSQADIIDEIAELVKWKAQRALYAEIIRKGPEARVDSMRKWNAFDQGTGLVAEGTYTCVALAKGGENAFVAHISPTRNMSEIQSFVDELVKREVKEINVYGMRGELLAKITDLLQSNGIRMNITLNPDTNKSFTIIVKGNEVQSLLE